MIQELKGEKINSTSNNSNKNINNNNNVDDNNKINQDFQNYNINNIQNTKYNPFNNPNNFKKSDNDKSGFPSELNNFPTDNNINNDFNKNISNEKKEEFKQLTTNLLDNYSLPLDENISIDFPVKYKSIPYKNLYNYIKNTLFPSIEQNLQNNQLKKCLKESEQLLYYLTNISPD
jgi:hypothetical protein